MSLRDELVEAMAKAYFYEVGRRSGSTLEFETAYDSEQADFKYVAGLALDAGLDYLEDAHEDWADHRASECIEDEHTGAMVACICPSDAQVLGLIAALRPPVSSSQENP